MAPLLLLLRRMIARIMQSSGRAKLGQRIRVPTVAIVGQIAISCLVGGPMPDELVGPISESQKRSQERKERNNKMMS